MWKGDENYYTKSKHVNSKTHKHRKYFDNFVTNIKQLNQKLVKNIIKLEMILKTVEESFFIPSNMDVCMILSLQKR